MLKYSCIWFILIINSLALEQLCSNEKSKNKCFCKQLTDKETHLPVTIADCNGINLDNFPDELQLRLDINYLDLSFNNINSLQPYSNDGSNSLKKLTVSHNKIERLNNQFFNGVPNLHVLDLSYNKIEVLEDADVFLSLKKLSKLILSFNNITELPSGLLSHFKHLRYLDVSYNPLADYFTHSKKILRNELGLTTNVTHIIMDNVGLTILDSSFFDGYDNLKYLSLADNSFKLVPTLPPSVEYLDFSGNNLIVLTTHYLSYSFLKVLKLNRMSSLTNIHHYAFYNLPSLQKLYVNDCSNLNDFSELVFGILSKKTIIHPKYMSLARNDLESLNSTFKFIFDNMYHVDLSNNPWRCDCDVLWIHEFKDTLYDTENMRCATPRTLRNRGLLELTEEDLPQCFPAIYGKRSHRILLTVLMLAVILLVALIAFLLKYPNLKMNSDSRNVSPESPYSAAPIIEA